MFFAMASLGLVAAVAASPSRSPSDSPYGGPEVQSWGLHKFTSLVAFGDSYTDDSRLNYIIGHNGTVPPVGWDQPVNYAASSGGRTWVQYVKQYTGVNLYNYAVGGAVCSDEITPRTVTTDQITPGTITTIKFPGVREYEVPAFIADSRYSEPDGHEFIINPSDETVYAIWIGTNDLGNSALLTDSQVPGTNIVSYVDCVFEQLQRLYDVGARDFVIMNAAPLNLSPLYGLPGRGGVTNDIYWPDKPSNITEISYRMMEQVVTVNAIYRYQAPFVARISNTFTGAHFAVMDVHALMTDIYNNPSTYLNGTAPTNVTGTVRQCNPGWQECTNSDSPDSFMWYDALHPSEQTGRLIAREFVRVVEGASKWATYWG